VCIGRAHRAAPSVWQTGEVAAPKRGGPRIGRRLARDDGQLAAAFFSAFFACFAFVVTFGLLLLLGFSWPFAIWDLLAAQQAASVLQSIHQGPAPPPICVDHVQCGPHRSPSARIARSLCESAKPRAASAGSADKWAAPPGRLRWVHCWRQLRRGALTRQGWRRRWPGSAGEVSGYDCPGDPGRCALVDPVDMSCPPLAEWPASAPVVGEGAVFYGA